MLLHQKVTIFDAYLTYKGLKVLFSAQKTKLMYMNQCRIVILHPKMAIANEIGSSSI